MAGNKNTGTPIVFISSTIEDLREHREAAAQAARAAGFLAILSEDWAARDHPPLDECLQQVDRAHLAVAIAAHRHGWVPEGRKDHKSITRLECERAAANGQALLPFILVNDTEWPDEKRERHRLTQAYENGEPPEEFPRIATEIAQNDAALKEFKKWLSDGRIRRTFSTNLDTFRSDVKDALRDWLEQHPEFRREVKVQAGSHADPTKYLQDLYKTTAHIDIRGLAVGSGKAHRFPIGELYVELEGVFAREHTKGGPDQTAGSGALAGALGSSRLVIIGDPGSGKTTFLRWLAHTLTGDRLGLTDNKAKARFGLEADRLPVFVSIADWLTHIGNARGNGPCPTTERDAAWLPHFLETRAASLEQGLDAGWFRALLKDGKALVLLDGLDEAADRQARERVELIEAVATAWPKAPLVVTSRPVAYRDRSVLPGFETTRIEPLSDVAVETFLTRWSQALHPGDASAAREHHAELTQALGARPNIRRLARNTVMLTALAVVHWNEKRLPEQRAELYESILTWLARARERRPGRAGPERSLEVLRALALAMQDADGGRRVQVPRREAAERVADLFGGNVAQAERFLEEEELDSGILVRRGNEVRFWHLTFQEYLAARAVAGLGESAQRELLLGAKRRFHAPEWKEVVLLLAGVLYEQGRGKVDGLVAQVLDDLHAGGNPELPEQARAFGLLGALVRDLAPFDYRPADGRHLALRDAVMGLFERQRATSVRVEDRIAAAEALGRAGDPRLADEGLRWVAVPGGRFLMGAQKEDRSAPNFDPDANNDETPHQVELDGFRLGRWPVTVAEYARFLDDGGYRNPEWWEREESGKWGAPDRWEGQSDFPNRPVSGISWYEATAYCAWLTVEQRRIGKLPAGSVIRLPTETEWEWAARRKSGWRWPWGKEDADPQRMNYAGKIGRPTPVGVYPEGNTPDGLLDLSGNVWEWCFDIGKGNYYQDCAAQGIVKNPTGPQEGAARVLRGGSWIDSEGNARAAYRGRSDPHGRFDGIGFRLCCASSIWTADH